MELPTQHIQGRLVWIDWMKCIGMYLIVLGHFFPVGSRYIYVFNVPLFFLISGFLCKRERNYHLFWKKLWHNLIVPTIIICLINIWIIPLLTFQKITFDVANIIRSITHPLIGMHSFLGVCWFIYTLILLKIVYQYANNIVCIILIVPSLYCAFLYNHIDLSIYHPLLGNPNAIPNTFTAYPFFIIGTIIQRSRGKLDFFQNKFVFLLSILFFSLLVYLCGKYNSDVWMFKCGYGNNLFLFIIGGMAGTIIIFFISKIIPIYTESIATISRGTILILGFHVHFVILFTNHFHNHSIFMDYAIALFILIVFVPIIRFVEEKCSIVIGKYRKK